jgi:hypothetical protein
LYTKVADKYWKEEKKLKAPPAAGLPVIGKPMEKHAVSIKLTNGGCSEVEYRLFYVFNIIFQTLKSLTNFRIPKRKPDESGAVEPGNFPTTTPGAGTSNKQGPELLKRARMMRFEGRFDKSGIGQQLVLAGFHQMPLEEKLRLAEELDEVEGQVAPDAPQEQLGALLKIFEKPYAKWGPAYANQLLTMFPKPQNSPVGRAPRFK